MKIMRDAAHHGEAENFSFGEFVAVKTGEALLIKAVADENRLRSAAFSFMSAIHEDPHRRALRHDIEEAGVAGRSRNIEFARSERRHRKPAIDEIAHLYIEAELLIISLSDRNEESP